MAQQLFIELPSGMRELDLEIICTKNNCTLIQRIDYPNGPAYEIEANDPLDFYRLGLAVAAKQFKK